MVATGSYIQCMRAVGIKVLKNKLSHYVRLAAAGETVLVTDRDKVVAELVPPTPGRAEALHDARLADAVRSGWIRPGTGPRGMVPPRYPRMSLAEVLAGLEADRGDRI
jgi:antitoxin (DNA-binding transcriptional repressor) of toxin-antitoxin stability system